MDIKKKLANDLTLEIPEQKFEEMLFNMITEAGYPKHIELYKIHQRTKPFLILLCGPPGIGLSSFTTLYASSLCISNIVPTSLIFNTMKLI